MHKVDRDQYNPLFLTTSEHTLTQSHYYICNGINYCYRSQHPVQRKECRKRSNLVHATRTAFMPCLQSSSLVTETTTICILITMARIIHIMSIINAAGGMNKC